MACIDYIAPALAYFGLFCIDALLTFRPHALSLQIAPHSAVLNDAFLYLYLQATFYNSASTLKLPSITPPLLLLFSVLSSSSVFLRSLMELELHGADKGCA